jgi:MYXO-CTERM domain-containing protein
VAASLNAPGLAVATQVSPTELMFGQQRVNTKSAPRSVVLSNTGTEVLVIHNISISGPFTLDSLPSTPMSVAPGESRTFSVTYLPTLEGPDAGTLYLITNDPANSTIAVALAGTGVKPNLVVSPSSVAFGDVRVGTSVTKTVTVRNTGTGSIVFNSITKSGHAAFSLIAPPATPFTLAPSEFLEFTVRYSPIAEATDTGDLILTTNDPEWPSVQVPVSGRGVKPNLVFEPNPLAFGDVRVGFTATNSVTVRNTGSGPITFTNIIKSGSETFSLGAMPAVPFTMAPGASQQWTVKYSPTTETANSGTLTLTSADPDWASVAVNLTGKGVKPVVVLSATSLDFGEQSVGSSTTMTVVVSNAGTGPITFPSISTGGSTAFSLPPPSGEPFTLPPGGSRSISVTFLPATEGVLVGTLKLATDDPAMPTVTVSLSGSGGKPILALSPTSLSFGAQPVGTTSAPRKVTVSNVGTGTLRISSIALTGTSFSLSDPGGPIQLLPGAIKELLLTFSPAAQGSVTGTLTLTSNDPARPSATVALSGYGSAELVLSPAGVLDFGAVGLGTSSSRTVTITNTSSASATLQHFSDVAAPFSVTGLDLPRTLPANSSISFTVTFSPTTAAVVNGRVSVVSDAFNSPHALNLSGTGATALAELSLPTRPGQTVLDFGGVRVNTSKVETVRLTNKGSVPLTFKQPVLPAGSPFSYVGPSTGTIPPAAYVEFQVSFKPTESVTSNQTLTIESDATNSPTLLPMTGFGAYSEAKLDQDNLFFGDVRVGSESPRLSVRISNQGTAKLTVQSLSVVGPFTVTSGVPLPVEVPVGAVMTFSVGFKPTVPGPATGSVSILTDANVGSSLKVTLQGNGTVSALKLSVATLDFGAQRVMETSGVQPVVLTNTGGAELEISEFIFSDSVFAISAPVPLPSSSSPLKIAAGASVVVSVTFTPKALGLASGKLHIISNAAEAPAPLELKGKGIDGQLGSTPSTVAFGSVEVGTSGTQLVVALSNTGESPLTITGVVPPAETAFSVSGLTPGLVLNPGEQRSFTVTFAPTRRGYLAGDVIIKSDARINPSYILPVSGTGIAPAVELVPKDLNFGRSNVGVTTSQGIAIKNVGEKELYVSNISFDDVPSGAPGAALDFSTEVVFPLLVKPGESTLVSLKFTPRAVGLRQARVIVHTNDKAAEASLQGEGTSPRLVVDPSTVDFGSVLVGSVSAPRTLRLTNTGTGPLILSSMAFGGADAAAFILTSPGLPVSLLPGVTKEVVVALRPDAERSFAAQLLVESNDTSASSVVVPLSGTGIRQQLQLSASSLEFGKQLINHTSSPRKVVVKNGGGVNATLTALTVEGASQFTLTKLALPLVLAPGQEQELAVAFTPLDETEVNGKLKLSFSESPQPLEVALRGKGIPTVLSIQPSPLDFGTVRVGGGKREQPLTLTNLSSETIILAAPERTYSTGESFLFDDSALSGRTIAPNESIIVSVGYQPMVETLSETHLSFGTTSPAKPRAVDVQLKGRATLRLLSADPGSLNFGRVAVGASAEPKVVTVTNKSSQLQRVVVKLRSAEGTSFSVGTKALEEPLPPGGSATFTVAFQPQTEGEAQNEVQVFLQGETEAEALIPVTGMGEGVGDPDPAGGCSCGSTEAGSAGMLALLALVGLGSRRRRRA